MFEFYFKMFMQLHKSYAPCYNYNPRLSWFTNNHQRTVKHDKVRFKEVPYLNKHFNHRHRLFYGNPNRILVPLVTKN